MEVIKKILKFLGKFIIMLSLIGIAVMAYLGYKYYPKYVELKDNAEQTVANIDDNTFKRLAPTQIIRPDGTLIREFTPLDYEYVSYEDIPEYVREAFVSIEDKRFRTHDGVDYKAILRATVSLIKNKGQITQGGSTITQQLVKLTFLTQEQSYSRKINEIFIAWELENNLTKDKILEYYINNIYFGNGAYGFETAANHYFSKPSEELSLAQITFLAAIPNNPTIFDPINNKDNTHKRQKLILQNMLDDELIDEATYNKAINETIELNIKEKANYVPEDYEVSFVMHSAIELIMEIEDEKLTDEERKELDYNTRFAEVNNQIRQGGYTLVSTIIPEKQELLQRNINDGLKNFTAINEENNLYKTQGAGVMINNETNEVEAIIGGRTAEGQVNTFNRAVLAYRQPGSIMKPIAAYGVEADIKMLAFTEYNDVKDKKGPNNSNHKYKGKMTAREAIERSVNTIPFELVKNRGPQLAHEYLHKMGFKKVVDGDLNAGIAIGGLTYGVTPLEMTSAYATLANNGEYIKPVGVSEIKFNDKVIYTNEKKGEKIYEPGSAYILTDMMKGVLEKEWGTGKRQKLDKMPAAGKTGTTDDNKDGWFAGYTPYYTTVIWVGNDNPTKIKGLYGGTYPGKIWKNVMEEIHKGLEVKDFEKPRGVKTVYVSSNGTIYDYKRKGAKEQLMPAHLYEKYNIFDINGKGSFQKREEEERARKIREARKKKEKEFYDKYGVTLVSEEKKISELQARIWEANAMSIRSQQDLYDVLDKLEYISYDIDYLYDDEHQAELKSEIGKSEVNAKNRYTSYLDELERQKIREQEERERQEYLKELEEQAQEEIENTEDYYDDEDYIESEETEDTDENQSQN